MAPTARAQHRVGALRTDLSETDGNRMTTRLNKHSCDFAQDRIKDGKVVHDERDDWSEHQPSTRQENRFIEANGWDEYANWHLGIDDEASEHTKARYKYPYGDFRQVHRCGVLAAEVRAGRRHADIENATSSPARHDRRAGPLSGPSHFMMARSARTAARLTSGPATWNIEADRGQVADPGPSTLAGSLA